MWPSEIEQDEKDGWHLRVQPYRDPSHRANGYHIYSDDNINREYYHDERTDAGGYGEALTSNERLTPS